MAIPTSAVRCIGRHMIHTPMAIVAGQAAGGGFLLRSLLHIRWDAVAVLAAIVLGARILVELGAFFQQHERADVLDWLLVILRVLDRGFPVEMIEVRARHPDGDLQRITVW